MKKILLLLVAALCAVQTISALAIEEGKFYTIRNFSSNSTAYMADTEAADNRLECVATISES
ncbi:MAG: hypothetical protein IKT83_07740, partial [Bacteroidaceae bacterium]|nr:hypothetical protein [Bacteroidaceae bacterium]